MTKKINFTKSAIEAIELPKEGSRTDVHDTKVNGLTIRVSYTGVKTFSVLRRIKMGRLERVTLGRFPDMTIEQARRKAMEINLAISEGNNPAELRREKNREMQFSDLFSDYIERHAKHNKKTWEEDTRKYKNHIHDVIGKLRLSEIQRQDIARIHSNITRIGSPYSANRTIALLSSVFGWAVSVGLCESNPVLGIKRNREKSRDRFLHGDELTRFFQSLAEENSDLIRDYVLISLFTGARKGNVLSMKWSDIDLESRTWRIEETKNGMPQVIPLSNESIQVLLSRKEYNRSQYVFQSHGKSGHLVEPKKGWRKILDRAGIENLRLHDLRRTFGSWQAKTGASLGVIGKSLNHKHPSSTAVYARLDLDPVRDSVSTATSAIVDAAGINVADMIKITKREK